MVELRIGYGFNGYFVVVVGDSFRYLFYDGKYRIDDWFGNYDRLGLLECNRQVYYVFQENAELAIEAFRRQEKMNELKKVEAEIQRLEALKKKLTQTFREGQWFKSYSGKKYQLAQTGHFEFNLVGLSGNRYSRPLKTKGGRLTWENINELKTGLTPINVIVKEVD